MIFFLLCKICKLVLSGTCDAQDCVRNWLQSRLDTLYSTDADPVLSLTKQFIVVLRDTALVLTPMSSISQYFARLGLDYYKMASIACDSKVLWQPPVTITLHMCYPAIKSEYVMSLCLRCRRPHAANSNDRWKRLFG